MLYTKETFLKNSEDQTSVPPGILALTAGLEMVTQALAHPAAPSKKRVKHKWTSAKLRALGFDQSYYDRAERIFLVRCSQCASVTIQGTPCHERGCPHERR